MRELVHRFEVCGKKMVLDVNSGTLLSIDNLIWDILSHIENRGWDQIEKSMEKTYSVPDIEEGITEIKKLISDNLLFTPFYYEPNQNNEKVVKAMCLFASDVCNLNCTYCFLYGGTPSGNGMLLSLATGKKALDFLIQNSGKRKNLEVDFFGGEPLLNLPVIKDIVKYARTLEKQFGKKFKFTITTNGLNLNQDAIEFINSECENVVISIDGRQNVHDKMRQTHDGNGSYDCIVKNADDLVKARGEKDYYIRGTFSRYNLDFDSDVIHLVDLGFKHVSIEPVVEVLDTGYTLSKSDLPAVYEAYERLADKYLQYKQNGEKFDYFHFNVDLDNGPCVSKRLTGCGAGNEYVAVTSGGDIYPCHQFVGNSDFVMGNVNDGSFNTSMQDKFALNNVLSKTDCSSCWAKFHCGGGCPANAYQFNSDISKPYELGCLMEKKRLECALMLSSM